MPGAGQMTDDQLAAVSKKSLESLGQLGSQIQWLRIATSRRDKIYCVYLAPDEATVQEHARRTGIPANRVSAVRRLLDPVNYR